MWSILGFVLFCLFLAGFLCTNKDFLKYEKWIIVVPILFILSFFSCLAWNYYHPSLDGSYLTNIVEVQDKYSKDLYYINLRVDVFEGEYCVTGYVLPRTGEMIDFPSDNFEPFGEENYFSPTGDLFESEFSTVVCQEDILDSNIKPGFDFGWLEFIVGSVLVFLQFFAFIKGFTILKEIQNEDMKRRKKFDEMYDKGDS